MSLPDSGVKLVIDAKFPLEAFNALKAARGETEIRNAEARLRGDVLKHVKDIAEKYLIGGETHETAIMFVPSESVYAELYEKFEDVIQKAHRARVIIASPNVLMLLVQTLQAIFKDARMREQAGLIKVEVTRLLEDVGPAEGARGRPAEAFRRSPRATSRSSASPPTRSPGGGPDREPGPAGTASRRGRAAEAGGAELNMPLKLLARPPEREQHRNKSHCLQRPPRPDRLRQRAFVEIIEFAADRHAMGEAGGGDAQRLQALGDVMRRGLALDGGVERQHHFLHAARAGALDQRAMLRSSGLMPSMAESVPPST